MKSVLVTGVFGFLGTNILKYYKEKGFYVCGIGRTSVLEHENTSILDEYYIGPITTENLQKFENKFDLVIHCAGSGSVGKAIEDPTGEFTNTLDSTQILLEYIRVKQSDARLIITSSSAVYGTKHFSPIKETSDLDAMSLYGVHKELSEKLCSYYAKLYNVKISIIRFFSIYGPGLEKQLLWDACNKISNSKDKSLVFFGTGTEVRDFIEIRDALTLIEKASLVEESFLVLNGGTGEATSVKEIINNLVKLLSCECEISFNNTVRIGDPKYLCADITKSLTHQWEPKVKLMEGLKTYVKWYKKQN